MAESGKNLLFTTQSRLLMTLKKKKNIVGNGENAGNLPKTNFNFSFTFNISYANAFNLDQSIILSFGKELRKNENHGNF